MLSLPETEMPTFNPPPAVSALRFIRKYRGVPKNEGVKTKGIQIQEQTLRRKFNYAINQRWQDHTFA